MWNFWDAVRRYREFFNDPNYTQEQKRLQARDEIAQLKAEVITKITDLKSRGLQDHDQEIIEAKRKYMEDFRALRLASRQNLSPSLSVDPSDTSTALNVEVGDDIPRINQLQSAFEQAQAQVRAQEQAQAQARAHAQMLKQRDEALALEAASEPMDPSEPD